MKLSQLLQGLQVKNTYNDVDVIDVTSDSRVVEAGFL